MLSRRTEIILAVIVILGFILVLVFFLTRERAVEQTDEQTPGGTLEATDDVPPVDSDDIPAPQEVTATTAARIFVERFGSYSTESGYENVDDVMAIATDSLARRLQSLAEEARETSGAYYGVSTRIISQKTLSSTDTAMTFRLTTQREESFDSPANTSVRYQDIDIDVVLVGDDWLVNDFTWL